MHEAAEKGFQVAAEAYERGRPEYPQEAIDFLIRTLGISSGTTVVDLGAGTGKFTRLLVPSGARIMAIEPVEGMISKFISLLSRIEILPGTAETIPLSSSSVDVVTVAQAFHWFQAESALREIHRVLKPRGKLGLVWNVRNESVEWVARITDIIDPFQGNTPRYKTSQWRQAFEKTDLFTPLSKSVFKHIHQCEYEDVINRVASISFIAALSSTEKQKVLNEVREFLEHHWMTKGKEKIGFPYRTDVFWCTKN